MYRSKESYQSVPELLASYETRDVQTKVTKPVSFPLRQESIT